MTIEDLIDLRENDVLTFDFPVDRPISLSVDGKLKYRLKYRGHIVTTGRKRAFQVDELVGHE